MTTVPIFLHLQPLVAPLSIPEPPIILPKPSSTSPGSTPPSPKHLYFLVTLQDPSHSLRFTTVSQPCPADWMEVEYERSDWVEERLVEILRTGVEVIAQDVRCPSLQAHMADESTVRVDENGVETIGHSTGIAKVTRRQIHLARESGARRRKQLSRGVRDNVDGVVGQSLVLCTLQSVFTLAVGKGLGGIPTQGHYATSTSASRFGMNAHGYSEDQDRAWAPKCRWY